MCQPGRSVVVSSAQPPAGVGCLAHLTIEEFPSPLHVAAILLLFETSLRGFDNHVSVPSQYGADFVRCGELHDRAHSPRKANRAVERPALAAKGLCGTPRRRFRGDRTPSDAACWEKTGRSCKVFGHGGTMLCPLRSGYPASYEASSCPAHAAQTQSHASKGSVAENALG